MTLAKIETGPRIDYLKFVVPMDWDYGQQQMSAVVANINALPEGSLDRYNFKLTVLGPSRSADGKSRYCVEAWGERSYMLAMCVPMFFWEHLSRIDFRAPLTHTNAPAVEAYVQQVMLGKKGMRNVTMFQTKPRQKSASRDVGGYGICIGSRKSDTHTVVYARGSEQPAVEVRFQGRRAADIGAQMIADFADNKLTEPQADMLRLLAQPVKTELYRATGVTETRHLEQNMSTSLTRMANVQQAMEWTETPEEVKGWEDMELEQQEKEQRDRFLPTSLFKGPRIV